MACKSKRKRPKVGERWRFPWREGGKLRYYERVITKIDLRLWIYRSETASLKLTAHWDRPLPGIEKRTYTLLTVVQAGRKVA